MSKVQVEICIDSVASARAAAQAGVDRLELCSGLTDGGITPSIGLIKAVASAINQSIDQPNYKRPLLHVLIRSRAGDFLYDDDDLCAMLADIEAIHQLNESFHSNNLLGVSGVVIGCLTADGRVDEIMLRKLCHAVKNPSQQSINQSNNQSINQSNNQTGLAITFHRAIDMSDPAHLESNLSIIRDCGCSLILTSGMTSDVIKGGEMIKRMVQWCNQSNNQSNNQVIDIMPGGGVTEVTVSPLIQLTGARHIHGSQRAKTDSQMVFRREGVYMGGEKRNEGIHVEYAHMRANTIRIKQLIEQTHTS